MGYRDEYIRRLQESGEWDGLTTDRHRWLESLDDQTAGALMAHLDVAEVNSQRLIDTISDPDNPEAQNAATDTFLQGFVNLQEVFDGKLVHIDTDAVSVNLTPLGQTLADFFRIAKKEGIPLLNAVSALSDINRYCAMIVAKFGERDSESRSRETDP